MKNTVILIHEKRDDLEEFIREFPDIYIYVDMDVDLEYPRLVKIEHSNFNARNIIGNGIRQIHADMPNHNIVLANECVTTKDVKKIITELEQSDSVIIAINSEDGVVSKKRMLGIKIITKLFNMVHKQKANNIMSNVQGIPTDQVEQFLKLKGNSSNALINERFIIKDHNIDYRYTNIESNVYTDAPKSFLGYLKCVLSICFVFIKFMLSSLSSFVVDYTLSIGGYNLWSPLVVAFFASLTFRVPIFMLDVEIISTGIARIISSIYNYFINKKVVFSSKDSESKLSTACKYFTLVLIIWVFNTIILKLATTYLNIPFAFAKIIADIIMYFVSFSVQRDIIFKKRNK